MGNYAGAAFTAGVAGEDPALIGLRGASLTWEGDRQTHRRRQKAQAPKGHRRRQEKLNFQSEIRSKVTGSSAVSCITFRLSHRTRHSASDAASCRTSPVGASQGLHQLHALFQCQVRTMETVQYAFVCCNVMILSLSHSLFLSHSQSLFLSSLPSQFLGQFQSLFSSPSQSLFLSLFSSRFLSQLQSLNGFQSLNGSVSESIPEPVSESVLESGPKPMPVSVPEPAPKYILELVPELVTKLFS